MQNLIFEIRMGKSQPLTCLCEVLYYFSFTKYFIFFPLFVDFVAQITITAIFCNHDNEAILIVIETFFGGNNVLVLHIDKCGPLLNRLHPQITRPLCLSHIKFLILLIDHLISHTMLARPNLFKLVVWPVMLAKFIFHQPLTRRCHPKSRGKALHQTVLQRLIEQRHVRRHFYFAAHVGLRADQGNLQLGFEGFHFAFEVFEAILFEDPLGLISITMFDSFCKVFQ